MMNSKQIGHLTFIGLGLFDATDMSIKAKQVMRQADQIYAEFYTSILMGSHIKDLEQQIGKTITVLTREKTEEGSCILNEATKKKVCFVTGGDSLTATTHVDLRIQAISQGIKTSVIHGSSIVSAVPGLLGLQHYKFGRTTTLVYPERNYFPLSPYDVIKQNKTNGLHTLVLLDIQADRNRFMTATEAIQLLLKMEEQRKQDLIRNDSVIAVVGQAGSDHPMVRAGRVSELLDFNFGPPLHSLVVPGTLHFMEIEALRSLAYLPASVAQKLQKI